MATIEVYHGFGDIIDYGVVGSREKKASDPSSSTEKEKKGDIPQDILDSMDKALADAQAMLGDPDNLDSLEVTACRARIRAVKTLRKAKLTRITLKRLDDVFHAMDESHQGMRELKDRLVEQANYALRTGVTPRPMLLVGAPGCGKTSLSLSFAKALGQGYSMISVGGETATVVARGSFLVLVKFLPGSLTPLRHFPMPPHVSLMAPMTFSFIFVTLIRPPPDRASPFLPPAPS
jgi:ATP-dependent Lon protease